MNNMMMNPQALSQLGQVPLMYTNQAYDWMKQAQGADQATLADIMKQREREAQLAPIKQQQAEATLAQTQLGNTKQGFDNRVREEAIPDEIKAEIAKFAASVDENKWKGFQAKVNLGASQGDPKMVALMKQMPEWQSARQKYQEEMELAKIRAAAQVQAANVAGTSRVTAAGITKPDKLSSNPWYAYAQLAMMQSTLDPASTEAQEIAKKMLAIQVQAQEDADRKAAGQFVKDPVTGQWGPRKAPQLPGPAGAAPQQAAPTPQAPRPSPMQFNPTQMQWIQAAKKANPGMSDADIIAEGKRRGKL
jgi:hypothetical protein